MNGFTFYSNYYELIKYLDNEQRLLLYDAIFDYMFNNKEPEFDGLLKGIWINLQMPLNTSKNNGGRGGRPKKEEEKKEKKSKKEKTDLKPIENRNETVLKTNNNISYFLFLISNFYFNNINNNEELIETIKEWLKYKQERKEKYTEVGLKKLLSQIDKKCSEYGSEQVINLINECIASNYKGIIFDKLKNAEKVNSSKNENFFLNYLRENEEV